MAFSGTLTLEDIDYTEPKLNGFAERELPARFGYVKADDPHAATRGQQEYRILVVAEKYQTGFDQPLLTTMYVDKPLVGLAAVQTLSRLNRTHPLKSQEDVCVLDFANNAEDIQAAFKPYFEEALAEPTDPNLLYVKERDLKGYQLLVDSEIMAFAAEYQKAGARHRRRAASLSGRTRSCTASLTRPATGTRRWPRPTREPPRSSGPRSMTMSAPTASSPRSSATPTRNWKRCISTAGSCGTGSPGGPTRGWTSARST